MKTAHFINFSNHPSKLWPESQVKAAEEFGTIIDLPFPAVDEFGDEAYIEQMAGEYVEKILEHEPVAVLCQGEFCLAYAVISKLKEKGITVLAACSKRIVEENKEEKKSIFVFQRFRRY